MISHEKKFIFIHIPRTGGTNLSEFLLPYCDEESLKFSPFVEAGNLHASMSEYEAYYGKEILDYTLFTIVRDPWDRALSQALKHNNKIFSRNSFRQVIFDPHRHGFWPNSHFSFLLRPDGLADQEGPSQKYVLKSLPAALDARSMRVRQETLYWPYFLKFENYVNDATKMLDRLKIKYDIEKLKKKTNNIAHEHYSHYYLDDERKSIKKACGFDLQIFGYVFKDERSK